jgi:hypothetical protein
MFLAVRHCHGVECADHARTLARIDREARRRGCLARCKTIRVNASAVMQSRELVVLTRPRESGQVPLAPFVPDERRQAQGKPVARRGRKASGQARMRKVAGLQTQ